MKLLWLIGSLVAEYAAGKNPESGILRCPLASARLRMGVAALDQMRRGNENAFWDPGVSGIGAQVDWRSVDICVVPKYFHDFRLNPWLEACRAARRDGVRIVVDVCDYPFEKPHPVPAFYSEVLGICDGVTVNSERMAELMAPHTARLPLVIEDAVLGEMGNPRFAPGNRIELLWYGHPTNLSYLEACLAALAQLLRQKRCRLTVVTQPARGVETWVHQLALQVGPGSIFEARLVPWGLENMRMALSECDLVLIPSDPSDPLKAGASANRIAEALHAGRFPVASPLRSYQPFVEAAWLGQDLAEGFQWAIANPDQVLARIHRGQDLVRQKFAENRIGANWNALFESLLSGARR